MSSSCSFAYSFLKRPATGDALINEFLEVFTVTDAELTPPNGVPGVSSGESDCTKCGVKPDPVGVDAGYAWF